MLLQRQHPRRDRVRYGLQSARDRVDPPRQGTEQIRCSGNRDVRGAGRSAVRNLDQRVRSPLRHGEGGIGSFGAKAMNQKITRRRLAAAALGSAAALRAAQPAASPEDPRAAAQEQLRKNSEAIGKTQLSMSTEPAFSFKA